MIPLQRYAVRCEKRFFYQFLVIAQLFQMVHRNLITTEEKVLFISNATKLTPAINSLGFFSEQKNEEQLNLDF